VNKVGDGTQLKKTLCVVGYLVKTLRKFKNLGDTLEKKKLTMWKRAKVVGGCNGLNLDFESRIQELYTEYRRGNLLESHHFEAGKRNMKDGSLGR
jgi:hypothetical protein